MFTHRQKTLKTISGLLTGLILLVAVFIFVCPMGNMSAAATDSSPSISALCVGHAADVAVANRADTSGSCFGFHLSIMEQFTKALFEKVNVLFVVLLTAFGVYGMIFRITPYGVLQSRLTRLRQKFYLYFEIRERFQKRILAWLSIVNGFSIASAV